MVTFLCISLTRLETIQHINVKYSLQVKLSLSKGWAMTSFKPKPKCLKNSAYWWLKSVFPMEQNRWQLFWVLVCLFSLVFKKNKLSQEKKSLEEGSSIKNTAGSVKVFSCSMFCVRWSKKKSRIPKGMSQLSFLCWLSLYSPLYDSRSSSSLSCMKKNQKNFATKD